MIATIAVSAAAALPTMAKNGTNRTARYAVARYSADGESVPSFFRERRKAGILDSPSRAHTMRLIRPGAQIMPRGVQIDWATEDVARELIYRSCPALGFAEEDELEQWVCYQPTDLVRSIWKQRPDIAACFYDQDATVITMVSHLEKGKDAYGNPALYAVHEDGKRSIVSGWLMRGVSAVVAVPCSAGQAAMLGCFECRFMVIRGASMVQTSAQVMCPSWKAQKAADVIGEFARERKARAGRGC